MNGRLKIKSDDKNVCFSTIEIDGKVFPVTDITISGNVVGSNIWKVSAGFWVKDLDIDLIADITADINGKLGNKES